MTLNPEIYLCRAKVTRIAEVSPHEGAAAAGEYVSLAVKKAPRFSWRFSRPGAPPAMTAPLRLVCREGAARPAQRLRVELWASEPPYMVIAVSFDFHNPLFRDEWPVVDYAQLFELSALEELSQSQASLRVFQAEMRLRAPLYLRGGERFTASDSSVRGGVSFSRVLAGAARQFFLGVVREILE
jgi:hypothetical protein